MLLISMIDMIMRLKLSKIKDNYYLSEITIIILNNVDISSSIEGGCDVFIQSDQSILIQLKQTSIMPYIKDIFVWFQSSFQPFVYYISNNGLIQ